ncbi:response regulator with CheY-like receiver domain and winged-helix DNA-binding domain [Methanomethylovorans hollandica DSM 15978]|uniref:Response regulator with CheY-like receiver domain and winged-helix DNA-binding domain n=1 Tax=Methanomethylovorans hollandica (strain DSM 15978 / NBRC 107637 / DMS1) TaxID=867904 RepID=L0KXD4_METHD|nr:response regulator transcription factor [Methanomethylovorans hollandica]AGB48738.1 response regulator with CheY-like receiver domain and winged-helix DNA-binding domain [Methanomethylovorans hollandica DSM 15978]
MMNAGETYDIVHDLRAGLRSKTVLFLAPVDVPVGRIVYFYVSDLLQSDPQQKVVWLCLKTPSNKVLRMFQEYKYEIDPARIMFIDLLPAGTEPHDDILYFSSPSDHTKIASHVSQLFDKFPGSLLVIDSMTVLGTDNMQVVESFINFISTKVSEKNGSITAILGKDTLKVESEALIKSFFEIIVELTNIGEIHTEIGMKTLDARFQVEDGKLSFEYIQKKLKRGRLKILIVDDEPDISDLLRLSLSNQPYDFVVAYNGQQAIEATLRERPDLILLDIMMPDMDGYEVVEHLKQSATSANIPVIMISAKTAIEDKVRGMELGIDDYIAKPFDKREVNARIRMVMRRFGWIEEE